MLERESEELWSERVRLLLVGRWDLTDLREQHNRNVLSASLSLSPLFLSLSHRLAFSWSLVSVGAQSTGEGGSRLERAWDHGRASARAEPLHRVRSSLLGAEKGRAKQEENYWTKETGTHQ